MYKKTGERNEFTILTDEKKNTLIAEFLEMVIYDGREYAVMLENGADEVLIFGYSEQGKNEFFTEVADDEILDAVFEEFRKMSEDEFDFDGD